MKAKFSGFDPKKFFVDHIEKVIFGGMLLVVVLLVYQAISLEVYKKTPGQLTSEASNVQKVVAEADWQTFLKENLEKLPAVPSEGGTAPAEPSPDDRPLKPVDYAVRALKSFEPIPTLPIQPHNPPIEPALMNRRDPEVFAIANLEANAGAGSIALYDEPVVGRPGAPVESGATEPRRPGGRNTTVSPGGPSGVSQQEAPRLSASERIRQKKKQSQAYAEGMYGGSPGGPGGGSPGGEYYGAGMMAPGGPGSEGMQYGSGSGGGMYSGGMSFGGSKPKGYRWVCITGQVPLTQQQLEFFDKLALTQQTYRPTDGVAYTNFEVQYAEVPNDRTKPAEGDWKPVDMGKLVNEMDTWAAVEAPEVVSPMVVDPALTAWLPPRLDRTWGKDVVHSSFQSFMLTTREMIEEQLKATKETDDDKAVEEPAPSGNPFLRDRMNRRGGAGMYGSGGGMMPGGYPGGGMMPGGYPGGGYGSGYGGGEVATGAAGSEYVMFRFFDFFVEEGKNYTYRVRVSLRNPNYMQPAKNLENPETAKVEFLTTPWSEASPTINIPKSGELIVSGFAKSDKGIPMTPSLSREPEVDVIVRQWDRDTGVVAAKKLTMTRGRVGVFPKTHDVVYADPGTRKTEKKDVDFETGLQLVDMLGGQRMRSKPVFELCDMAFINEEGQLIVHSEATDMASYTTELQAIEDLEKGPTPYGAGPGGPGGPSGVGPGGPGGSTDPFGMPLPGATEGGRGRGGRDRAP